MSDEKPDYEGEGPEKMMREMMAQFRQSQGLPVPYYAVKREELVAHLAERADFWRSEVEEIKSGRRDIADEIMGQAQIIPRLPINLLGHEALAERTADEKRMLDTMKEQIRARAIKEAQDKSRTFAFLSKHVPKSVPEFGVDLHAARVLELIPSDLHGASYLAVR